MPHTEWLELQKSVVLQFWWLEVQGPGAGRVASSEAVRASLLHASLFASHSLQAILGVLGLWKHHPDLCLHAPLAFSLCAYLSLCPNSPFS